jgi:hypothetical protein
MNERRGSIAIAAIVSKLLALAFVTPVSGKNPSAAAMRPAGSLGDRPRRRSAA